jgi:phage tail sheath gpL-like
MTIAFNEIPAQIRVPFVYIEFDNTQAMPSPQLQTYRNLVMGQKLKSGKQDAEVPLRITRAQQAQDAFGEGSMLASMCEKLFENNSFTETWAVALEDAPNSTAATGALLFSGQATSSGTCYVYLAGRRISVGVYAGDDAKTIANRLVECTQDKQNLPLTTCINVSNSNQVDVVAKHGGEVGNMLDIRCNYYAGETLPQGLSITITPMQGGATNPDITNVLAKLGDTPYHIIAFPYTDAANLTQLEKELADRWTAMRQIEGMAFTAANGTFSELSTLGASRNSPYVSIMSCSGSPTPSYEWAAAAAGVVSFYAQQDPARPFHTLPLKGILAPSTLNRFTLQEQNQLLFEGISTYTVDSDNTVRLQRVITTYQHNANGAQDASFLDVNTLLTLSYLRFDFRNHFLLKYPRHKLADDGIAFAPGQAIITPNIGKAEAVAKFRQWEEQGLVENFDQFKSDLIVERNTKDPNRLDFLLRPNLVNQLYITGVQVQFLL